MYTRNGYIDRQMLKIQQYELRAEIKIFQKTEEKKDKIHE